MAEFGRFLLYNILVDSGEDLGDMEDSDDENDDQVEEFRGYKQLLLVLQSKQVETGKSLLSEVLLRIFHGRKTGLQSTVSFDSAKVLLGKGDPVVIDDFNNDDVGSVLISRASKAIWGKANILIKNTTVTPNANLLFCTNEDISNLRVEGKNKTEIHQKLSVIDLGETPMSSSNKENKVETLEELIKLTKVVRKFLPSFYGLMLRVCGKYITPLEFKQYEDVTAHERLANILKNAKNLHEMLNKFCEQENIVKPESLAAPVDTSCLTNKSELVHKFKTPDQIVDILMSKSIKMCVTEHDQKQGIVFPYKVLTDYPWFGQSFSREVDGVKVFSKMRTRQLSSNSDSSVGAFLSFNFLKESAVIMIKEYVRNDDEDVTSESFVEDTSSTSDVVLQPKEIVANFVKFEFAEREKQKKVRFQLAEQYTSDLANKINVTNSNVPKHKCNVCGLVTKSKGGLTNHKKKCK